MNHPAPALLKKYATDLRYSLPVMAVLILAVAGGAFLLTRDGGTEAVEPTVFAVLPSGDEVARLEPVRVTFEAAPRERDGAKILALEPAVPGVYAWLGERTLLFQPDYPGYLRGFAYTAKVRAQPDAGLVDDVEVSFQTAGKLEVVSTIPADGDEDIPAEGQIFVQFSRSVAPLTILAARDTSPVLVFDPPLAGTGEWLNTSLYRFLPDEVAPNTTYAVTIPAGLTSAADGVLEEDYSFRFTSYGPALVRVAPDRQTEYAAPRQAVTLEFNQAMDRAAVETGFALLDAGTKVSGRFSWDTTGTIATFTPDADLSPLATHQVELSAGLPGINGGETLYPWSSTFKTVGPLRLVMTEPADGATAAYRYGVSLTFSHPIDVDTLDGRVRISGIEPDEVTPGYSDGLNAYYYAQLEPSTTYTVTIAAGIADRYGQTMPATSFRFTTEALPTSVSAAVPNYVAVYATSSEPILYYHASNVATASFSLYPLTTSEMERLRKGYGFDKDWRPSQPAIRVWSETVGGPADEVQVLATSITGGGLLPKGDYYVATAPSEYYLQGFAFSVIDTSLVVKVAYDEVLAWAVDYQTGQPLEGVRLEATGAGLLSRTAVTDGDGLASFRLQPATEVPLYSEREFVVTLNDGVRYGVAATTWQQGASPYELGVQFEYYPVRYKGHIYTDRPIYRPGETVEIKAIVRDDDDARYTVPDDAESIDVVIRDPQGTEVLRQDVVLSPHGTFPVSLPLDAKASTGNYIVELSWSATVAFGGTQQVQFAATSFLVAEFRRPEFDVTVTTPGDAYVNGETIAVTAEASFFFGGAVQGAGVQWSVLSSPASLSSQEFARYSFSDYDYWNFIETNAEPVRLRGSGVTGTDGRVTFGVPATLLADEGPQEFTIAATVIDENGQALSASTSVTVHPADRYAGIRTTEWLGIAGEASTIELVTLTKEGALAPNTPVQVEVYERRWITTKVQTSTGARQYRSEPVDELVATLAATTGADATGTTTFSPTKTGTLRIVAVVTDASGREARSGTYLWVGGSEYASWRVTNDDLIALVADRDEYRPGDTAEILVPSPYEGMIGLVTVERGTIHDREVRTFATNSERISIPLGDESMPNVFVSVVLYRPPTAEDPVPRYKVGYVNLKVSTESRHLAVSIRPDRDQAQPGDTVTYTVEVKDWEGRGVQAEVSVAVVDKAVLALEDERSIDGLKAFWFERGLGVRTASTMAVSINRSNDAIPAPQGGGKGGGGFDKDTLRTEFRNTAYWHAQIQTDGNGVAHVSVKLPDNLTTWRFQARAISGDILVGEATNELVSTRPLLLRPALPRFLRVGDQVHLRVLVRNATDASTTATVGIEASGIRLGDQSDRTVNVGAGQSVVLAWPALAFEEGTATVTFDGRATNGTEDAVQIEFPVHLDVSPEAVATNGVVTGAPALEAIYLPEFAILEGGALDISVQPTLVGSIASELPSFFPRWDEYESAVGISSRAIAISAVLRATPEGAPAGLATSSRLRSDIATLLGRQRSDGGWAWCDPRCDTSPLVTAWAILALGEASHTGIQVDESSVQRADSYLAGHMNRVVDLESPIAPGERAMYLYALAVAGRGETHEPEMRAVFEQYRAQLEPSGKAYLLLALHETGATNDDTYVERLLNDLASSVEPSANGNHWEDGERSGLVRTPWQATALVLTALSRVQPEHPLIEETVRWLTVARSTQPWNYGPERAQAVLSLAEFATMTGELGADFAYEVDIDGKNALEGSFDPDDAAANETLTVPLTEIGKGKVTLLEFARKAAKAGRLYYKLDMRYLTAAREIEALNRGFAISHEYSLVDDPTSTVVEAAIGELVRVKVTVVTTQQRNYVLVRDYLPAGLEPIDTELDSTDPALIAQLEHDRLQLVDDGGYVPQYWAPWYRWYYSPWKQVDLRDDRVELRTDTLPAGVHEYIYYARATAPGTFFVAPPHAEEGLFPEVFGRGDSGRFTVAD